MALIQLGSILSERAPIKRYLDGLLAEEGTIATHKKWRNHYKTPPTIRQ